MAASSPAATHHPYEICHLIRSNRNFGGTLKLLYSASTDEYSKYKPT